MIGQTLNNVGPNPATIIQALESIPGPIEGHWYAVTRGSDVGVFQHVYIILVLFVPVANI